MQRLVQPADPLTKLSPPEHRRLTDEIFTQQLAITVTAQLTILVASHRMADFAIIGVYDVASPHQPLRVSIQRERLRNRCQRALDVQIIAVQPGDDIAPSYRQTLVDRIGLS